MKTAYRLLAAVACFALIGCGQSIDIKEKLGLNRQGPDEYRVVPRPPLSVPPDFNMRPPGQESDYVSGKPADQRAHDQVLGSDATSAAPAAGFADSTGVTKTMANTAVTPVTAGDLPSGSDAQFLADIGANNVDPQIRQKLLDEKMNGINSQDPNYLLGGKTKSDSVVDATKEADRLNQDKSQNLPPTAGGDTPVVQPKDKGLLGDIF